ncbi:leucine-rich repeat domain-containing protein [Luteolibacter arcticus]|uniref:non-specific serine/threonine protein kinase n=1 Tax=Luteolibacter arcticus TaxID=1581411 RepID=A0ABT3GD58_9BACT|nr:leucine-rich repeat domain-containing protein [Luteolibacter arcticus]MCW1921565.1 leucine-rich repeat domain-containing protein [Luteolibacter arcticus]
MSQNCLAAQPHQSCSLLAFISWVSAFPLPTPTPNLAMTANEQAIYNEALQRIEECRRSGGAVLNLCGIGLTCLPPEVGRLTALTELYLHSNQLTSLPPEIGGLTALTELSLHSNQLTSLPREIGKLTALTTLSLNRNQLATLPPEIGKLTALTTLSLNRNQLATLPPEIGKLAALRELYLHSNQLTALPSDIGKLTALRELYLDRNQLATLPSDIGKLTALTELYLDRNQLATLPSEIGKLAPLTTLNLNRNQLGALPSDIGKLAALTTLYLHGNQLATLPPDIGKLSALRTLSLNSNQLATLPPDIGKLTALTALNLDSNQLTTLPTEIGRLTALTTLSLHSNQLATLPPDISRLTALRTLYLDHNQLATLPPEIGKLTALTKLSLHRNQLISLPPEIGKLTTLTTLSLNSNQLAALPPNIGRLPALMEIFLHENPGLGIPESVLGPTLREVHHPLNPAPPTSPRAIFDFYFALQQQGEAPMREVRTLLVGRGRVGKTSLIKALQNRPVDLQEKETPGISVEELPLHCAQADATARIWDFGGQEFLHGTHQIFLSERCVYVLVMEGREGSWEQETDYWLRFIQSFGGDSPVIVALGKYDLHPFSVDRHRLKERCPHIAGFVQVDAVTGRGIAELRTLLEETVSGMPEVWHGVPKKWHRIKQELESMASSHLAYREYQALCRRLDVTAEGEQDSLAQTLHRLGVALNFRDHHRLRNTSVLKPQWVTEAIYGLIRHTQQQDCHGVLREEDLGEALKPAEEYPPELHGFVLGLMEKFEVAFTLGETHASGKSWLIPELLGEEQPDAFLQFRSEGVRRLRFSYPEALPPGLLPRLIVRTREMSDSHPGWRWRSGVVLEWCGCQALVRLDRLERRTDVAICGGTLEERQALFDIIRSHLIVLHGNVRAVEETEIDGHPGVWVKVAKLRLEERKGTKQFDELISDVEEAAVEVSKELDQVESDAATEASGPDPKRRIHLFISYAHVNEKELIPFRQNLALLSQQGYIQIWHDRNLVAGEKWETGVLDELGRAEIVLLFYTTGARISSFIQKTELRISLDRSDKNECVLIWVPLERNDLDKTHPLEKRLSAITCGTVDKKKIYDFEPNQIGWMQVEESIRNAVEKRRCLAGDKDHLGPRFPGH